MWQKEVMKSVWLIRHEVIRGGPMSEFRELIKSFSKSREYIRDFFVYGFKTRDEFGGWRAGFLVMSGRNMLEGEIQREKISTCPSTVIFSTRTRCIGYGRQKASRITTSRCISIFWTV